MQTLLDAVADRATVTLAEADPSATGQRRVDRKYLVGVDVVLDLVAALGPAWRVLEIDGERLLPYDNVYFDTADRRLHRAAVQRHRRRVKVRTRRYGTATDDDPTAVVVAEAKHKGVRGVTLKGRQSIDSHLHGDPSAAFDSFDDATQRLDELDVTADQLAVALHTAYRRLALVGPEGMRLTIDIDVTCWNESGRVVFGDVIVETKSPGPPTEADRHLWRRGVRPLRLSKYSTALSMLEPACAGNRWRRTIDQHDIRVERSTPDR